MPPTPPPNYHIFPYTPTWLSVILINLINNYLAMTKWCLEVSTQAGLRKLQIPLVAKILETFSLIGAQQCLRGHVHLTPPYPPYQSC